VEAFFPEAPAPPAPAVTYPVRGADGVGQAEVERTTHFECRKGEVWAHVDGTRAATFWTALAEVEPALGPVLFARVGSRYLVNPVWVRDLVPRFGGGSRVRLEGGTELLAGRADTRRLKFLLGI
jgi:DNA-binding LytR/AlgR family response regulator